MTSAPLISLVVPTRERKETLSFALQSALRQSSRSFEIVVGDNFSQDGTRELVDSLDDPRIHYCNSGRRLSMSDNWEFSLQHARGEYVLFIGDDDAVLPGGIDMLEAAINRTHHQAYMWDTPIYSWPIDEHRPDIARLQRPRRDGILDLKAMARFVFRFGGWRYWKIPGVYHAAVSTRLLEAIRRRTGRVFHTTQPDLFASMAVPVYADESYFLGCPVTSHGMSAKATSGSSVARNGDAVLATYMGEFGDYRIHGTLYPGTARYANLIADAFLVAKDLFPEFYGPITFNYTAMWAFLCRLRLLTPREVFRDWKAVRQFHPFGPIAFLGYYAIHRLTLLRLRVLKRFSPTIPFARCIPADIDEFVVMLSEWLTESCGKRYLT